LASAVVPFVNVFGTVNVPAATTSGIASSTSSTGKPSPGPDGRMVPTRTWRTQTPSIRDVMDLPYGRNFTLRFWKHAE
jgi:hypothetical protein